MNESSFLLKRFFIFEVNSVNLKKFKFSEGVFGINFLVVFFLVKFFLVTFFQVMLLKGKYEMWFIKEKLWYLYINFRNCNKFINYYQWLFKVKKW